MQSSAIVMRCRLSSSVTRVFCDKPVEARITRFSLKGIVTGLYLSYCTASVAAKIEGSPLDRWPTRFLAEHVPL